MWGAVNCLCWALIPFAAACPAHPELCLHTYPRDLLSRDSPFLSDLLGPWPEPAPSVSLAPCLSPGLGLQGSLTLPCSPRAPSGSWSPQESKCQHSGSGCSRPTSAVGLSQCPPPRTLCLTREGDEDGLRERVPAAPTCSAAERHPPRSHRRVGPALPRPRSRSRAVALSWVLIVEPCGAGARQSGARVYVRARGGDACAHACVFGRG